MKFLIFSRALSDWPSMRRARSTCAGLGAAALIVLSLGLSGAAGALADPLSVAVNAYGARDFPRAAPTIRALAERGDARAQTYLGFMYETGRGVPQDYSEAARWFGLAADQGVPDAQYLLGLMFDKGQGVEQDFVRAYGWLDLAVAAAPPGEREDWVRIRDAVAGKMTRAQIEQGQKLALAWRPVAEVASGTARRRPRRGSEVPN